MPSFMDSDLFLNNNLPNNIPLILNSFRNTHARQFVRVYMYKINYQHLGDNLF